MTIKQAVKDVLVYVPGNYPFAASSLPHIAHEDGTHFEVADHVKYPGGPWLSNAQISRALNSLHHVKHLRSGVYKVKGRKVS